MTDNTVEEFVVTAKKQDGFLNLGNNMYGYWGERGGSAGSGSSGQSVFTITVSISDPAHKADVEAAAVNLAKEIAKLDPVIKGLNPNTVIQLFDGTTIRRASSRPSGRIGNSTSPTTATDPTRQEPSCRTATVGS